MEKDAQACLNLLIGGCGSCRSTLLLHSNKPLDGSIMYTFLLAKEM